MDKDPLNPNPDDYTPDDEEYWTGLEFPDVDDPDGALFSDLNEISEDNQDYTPEDYEGNKPLFSDLDEEPEENI
jgi:hypothetical protein